MGVERASLLLKIYIFERIDKIKKLSNKKLKKRISSSFYMRNYCDIKAIYAHVPRIHMFINEDIRDKLILDTCEINEINDLTSEMKHKKRSNKKSNEYRVYYKNKSQYKGRKHVRLKNINPMEHK